MGFRDVDLMQIVLLVLVLGGMTRTLPRAWVTARDHSLQRVERWMAIVQLVARPVGLVALVAWLVLAAEAASRAALTVTIVAGVMVLGASAVSFAAIVRGPRPPTP